MFFFFPKEIKDLVSTTAGMGGAGVLDMTMASSDFEKRLLSLEFREHSRVLVTDTETLWHEEVSIKWMLNFELWQMHVHVYLA